MTIPLDLELYPFIIQGFPRGPKAESDLVTLFDQMEVVGRRAVDSGTVHVVIAVGDEGFSAAERKMIAGRMATAPPDIAERVVGAFAVIENAFARGILTALKWLAPNTIPIVPARTPEEAIDLAAECLRAKGVSFPRSVEERARTRARALHMQMRGRSSSGPPRPH